jgi:hypothetical protein
MPSPVSWLMNHEPRCVKSNAVAFGSRWLPVMLKVESPLSRRSLREVHQITDQLCAILLRSPQDIKRLLRKRQTSKQRHMPRAKGTS